MQIKDLDNKEVRRLIDLYFEHKNEFLGLLTIEDFTEQFCRKCDNCGRVICILDDCKECDEEEQENEFWEFELNKERILYDI